MAPSKKVPDLVALFENGPPTPQPVRVPGPSVIRGSLSSMDWTPRNRVTSTPQHIRQEPHRPRRQSLPPLQPADPVVVPPSVRRPQPQVQRGPRNLPVGLEDEEKVMREHERRRHPDVVADAREQPRPPPSPPPPSPKKPPSPPQQQPEPVAVPKEPTESSPMLSKGDEEDSISQQPASSNPSASPPRHRHPLPASQVFASTSLPLYLPELDRHLSDLNFFSKPNFSADPTSFSAEEKALFHIGGSKKLEVAGDQLKLSDGLRKRRRPQRRRRRTNNDGFHKLESNDYDDDRDHDDDDDKTRISMTDLEAKPSSPSTDPNSNTMLPPLMLLNTTTTLNELKSNAVGPRAPPSGFLSGLPGFNTIIGSIMDTVVGVEGSTFAAAIFRFGLLRDFAQLMRLNLNFSHHRGDSDASSPAEKFFFQTIPSILALDFVSVFGLAVVFLVSWFVATTGALLWFWRMTSACDPNRDIQGFEGQPYLFRSPRRGTKAANIAVTFLLMTLYIPLTKLAMDVVLWSSDFWVVEATKERPDAMCWTTAKHEDEFNFAWVLVPLAVLVLVVYTVAWPIYMARVILHMRPQQLSQYNQLGVKRTRQELEVEYNRQLSNDKSPLRFLYSAYRRHYSTYDPIHLVFFRMFTVLIVALCASNNCLWHDYDPNRLLVAQEACLTVLQSVLLVVHLCTTPFNDAIANRSELCSRVTYVATSALGLVVALQGKRITTSAVLWTMMGISYTLSLYFAVVSTSLVGHAVKRAQRRLDWNIDIYSPHLRLGKHIRRRVWEETLSILLLTGKRFRMPLGSVVAFLARQDEWPPYLLFFQGTPAERHVENLQILKQIGIDEYRRQVHMLRSTPEGARILELVDEIQRDFAGPDAYYRPATPAVASKEGTSLPSSSATSHLISYFGKAFIVPFPPTLVFRYDDVTDDSTLSLTTLADFESFVAQNRSHDVQSQRMVRLSLRALDGQRVVCPYEIVDDVAFSSSRGKLGGRGGRETLAYPVHYTHATLRIAIKSFLPFQGYNFSSGFKVYLDYTEGWRFDPSTGVSSKVVKHKAVSVPASRVIGLHETSYALTEGVARFLRANEGLLRCGRGGPGGGGRFEEMQRMMREYREHFWLEAKRKREVMPYSFLCDVFDPPQPSAGASPAPPLQPLLHPLDHHNAHLTTLLLGTYPRTLSLLSTRITHLLRHQSSPLHAYWWLWWDDLVRCNGDDYPAALRDDPRINPRYEGSVAWTPMPRRQLEEEVLGSRRALKKLLHVGELNRLYFCLEGVWAKQRQGTKKGAAGAGRGEAIDVTLSGPHGAPRRPSSVDEDDDDGTLPCSSRFTGGGSSDGGSSILPLVDKPLWQWEERMLAGQGDGRRLGSSYSSTEDDGLGDGVGSWLRRAYASVLRFAALEPLLMPRHKSEEGHTEERGRRGLWVFVEVQRVEGRERLVVPSGLRRGRGGGGREGA